MRRRSAYRLLGETSLELKCLSLFGAFLLLVVTASFLSYWLVTETVVKKQNPNTGRLLADQALLVSHFEAFEADKEFLPVVKELTDKLSKQEYKWRYISPDPKSEDDDEQPKDEFEKELVARFQRREPPDYAEGPTAGKDEYQFYQAVRVHKSCVTFCHRPEPTSSVYDRPQAPYSDGDLIAVVQVTIPNGPMQAEISLYWNTLLAVAIITAFMALIAFYVTIRYLIVRPLKHLRDVSDAISHGNIALRAEIHTGDEFESLGTAFNRMLRHLVTIQNELRQVNVNLDGKVDELARVNMQLYEMNRIKSDFMATMSHELRTPLNSILGFSDVLGSIDALDEKQKRYVLNIQKSGRMLLEMINNILDLAKIEAGRMEIRLTEFDIEPVIAAQCDMARPLTEKKNIDLETRIEPDLPPLYQDQARVQQILNNLLSNAIKFTPEGGRVTVSTQRTAAQREELLLRVSDTGVGITAEDQQVIFEKFRQGRTALPAGDAMTREYSGTGLGLSIVKELCKLLEGEVSVESQLGTGSTFTVRLPWKLDKQPRLDAPLGAGFDRFKSARLDGSHDDTPLGGTAAP